MQKLKVKSQNGKGFWSLVLGLWSCILFGCSASGPPANPYTCPTASGYTLPDYCKTNFEDPLSTTSIGINWLAPYPYYLYTEATTNRSAENTIVPDGDGNIFLKDCSPFFYIVDAPPVSYMLGDMEKRCSKVDPNNPTDTTRKPPTFNPATDCIWAEYNADDSPPPRIPIGVFAFDPDGTKGSGLDVTISFLATDKDNVNAGIFDNSTNLLTNGAGKKVDWLASHPTNPSQRLASDQNYTITATGSDEKNLSFTVQFKVKVCKKGECACP